MRRKNESNTNNIQNGKHLAKIHFMTAFIPIFFLNKYISKEKHYSFIVTFLKLNWSKLITISKPYNLAKTKLFPIMTLDIIQTIHCPNV